MIFWINILRVLLWRRKHTEHWMNKTWLFWSQLLCSFSCKWTYDSWYVQVCFVYTSHLFHWIIQQNFIQFHLKSKNQFIVTWLEYEEINFPVKPLRCIIIFRLVLISSTLYRSLSPCPPPSLRRKCARWIINVPSILIKTPSINIYYCSIEKTSNPWYTNWVSKESFLYNGNSKREGEINTHINCNISILLLWLKRNQYFLFHS